MALHKVRTTGEGCPGGHHQRAAPTLDANVEWQAWHRDMRTEAMVELTPLTINAVPTQITTVAASRWPRTRPATTPPPPGVQHPLRADPCFERAAIAALDGLRRPNLLLPLSAQVGGKQQGSR